MTADELWTAADLIVLATPTGTDKLSWSVPGGADDWANGGSSHALIYNDQEVTVKQLLKGQSSSSTLTVRNVGGTLDGFTITLEGLDPLEAGGSYILALTYVEAPIGDDIETVLSFVGLEQGILRATESGFSNDYGVTFAAPSQ